MKKLKYILCLVLFLCLCTGCVKYNATMSIKKDKSMDFTLIYAADKSLLDGEDLLKDEDKTKLKNKGFKIKDYKKDSMEGYELSMTIKNIDRISTTKNAKYNLSGILKDENDKNNYVFKVKKSLFKNHYYADFKFDSSDSNLSSDSDVDYREEDESTEESADLDSDSDFDFSKYASMDEMDLSFNVNLPYAAIKNNASKTNNDDKELSWNLTSSGSENITFEFELYNIINIIIISVVGGLLVIGAVVLIIVLVIKKRNNKPSDTNVVNNQPAQS